MQRDRRRQRVVLATKVHGAMADDDPERHPATTRRHIVAECEASLRRLQTEYIDRYQIHRPEPGTAIESEQPPYNILDWRVEREPMPTAQTFGIGVLPWGPIAGGLLSGKYKRGEPPPPAA